MENLFSTEIHQVLNVISPPELLVQHISNFKKELREKYGNYESSNSTAHITVNSYLISSDRVNSIHEKFNKFILHYPPLEIKLNGFGFWDSSRTIYLKVESNPSLETFKRDLDIWRKENYLKSNYIQPKVSHLTIAKKLKADVYTDVKSNYKDLNYKSAFKADHILSLIKTNSIKGIKNKIWGMSPLGINLT